MLFLQNIRSFFDHLMNKIFGGSSYYVGQSQVLPSPLSREEELLLLEQMNTDPDRVRNLLITHNLRLVVYIAKKFESSGILLDDLISIGTIGLIKAVNTFSPEKKIKLATYASRCIENEILMVLRKNVQTKGEISIDEPLNVDWDGNELLLSDVLGTDGDLVHRNVENEVEVHLLNECVKHLSSRERTIMELRFGLGGKKERTQKEVADQIGISQSYISRLEKRIIRRLRAELDEIL